MASASVSAPGSPNGHQVTVINLQAAYQAQMAHPHKPGKIAGVVPGVHKQPRKSSPAASCVEPDHCPLLYQGGLVQHSPHVYLLLWGPNWSTDSSQAATASHLESFYAGLGTQPQDSWSDTTDQYTDGTGHPSFSGSVYKGAWQDTSTPPTGVDQSQLAADHRRHPVRHLPAGFLLAVQRRVWHVLRLAFQQQRALHQPAVHPGFRRRLR
jgi:hypothetical protein